MWKNLFAWAIYCLHAKYSLKSLKICKFCKINPHSATLNIAILKNVVKCESLLESNYPDILALLLYDWFWWFFYVGLSFFNPKGFYYSMHGLAIYVNEGLTFAWDLENSADSYLCFWLGLLYLVPYFFFLYWSSFVVKHGLLFCFL